MLFCNRLSPDQSYFDVLPPLLQSEDNVDYSQACQCFDNRTHKGHGECDNAFNIAFPKLGKTTKPSPMLLKCDRDKRDINFSDEPTDEDLNRFKWTLPVRKRHKRESGRISKENATYYCEEIISNTKIAKLCAKIGINAHALVNACSFDLEVDYLRLL